MTIRTETIAIESLYGAGEREPGLLNRLLQLTSDEPTTAELEEALRLVSVEILAVLRAWISSRHLNLSHAHGTAQFTVCYPAVAAVVLGLKQVAACKAYGIPAETPAERAHPIVLGRLA